MALSEGPDGTLWIATADHLVRFANGGFSNYPLQHGPSRHYTTSLLAHSEGNTWIGASDGGLHIYQRPLAGISHININNLPHNVDIRVIYSDAQNRIWIGTRSDGLIIAEDGKFRVFPKNNGFHGIDIRAIFQDSRGTLWLGTNGQGLFSYKNDTLTSSHSKHGLLRSPIRAITEDREGSLWIGTRDGLSQLMDGKFITYRTWNGLPVDSIRSVFQDSKNSIWLGTLYGHLNRINLKTREITVFGQASGLTNHAIWSIYADKSSPGVIWLGTDGGGLVRFQEGNLRRYTAKDGLLSNLAFAVFEDFHGNLWKNCNKGIYSVKKKDLENFSDGLLERIPCRSFGKAEGIKNTECNGPAQPAGLCSQAGKLWFPTIQGAVVIEPTNIRTNKIVPLVVIEELLADGKTLFSYPQPSIQRNNISVPAGKKRLEFFFTGLSFVSPAHVKFKYKLEGFDGHWMTADTQRHVSYTNISPGDYTFRVKACNNDGL
jgi:hypothetical protein